MAEEDKAVVRRLYEAMNRGDIASMREMIADDFIDHEELPGVPQTKDGAIQFFTNLRAAVPDVKMEIQDMLSEDNRIAIRALMTGTQQAELLGIPPTGKPISVPMADFLRIENGKVTEHWGVTDTAAMMR